MRAEIKMSKSAISKAKLQQLIRRFKIIAKCLQIIHKIKSQEIIFIVRVFYRDVADDSCTVAHSEDASGVSDIATISFYYHRV